jgi:TatD DNase family protein
MLVDSHCHFCFPGLMEHADDVLARMHAAGVGLALNISTSMRDLREVTAFAQRHEGIYATVGIHPDNEDEEGEPDLAGLVAYAHQPKVVAIGETGLDYYRLKEPLDWQRERFRRHIRAAREVGKPLVIHTRSSAQDTLRIMREEGAREVGGVMHCFTETVEVARAAMDLGFMISFSGILTFKNATPLREVAAMVPDDRMLVETDAPYLAPVPHRGKTNEPSWVTHVAATLAQLRGQDLELVHETTTNNFIRLFNILQ